MLYFVTSIALALCSCVYYHYGSIGMTILTASLSVLFANISLAVAQEEFNSSVKQALDAIFIRLKETQND